MLNTLTTEEVIGFLEACGYKLIELEGFTEKRFAVEHDGVCLITGNGEHVFGFLLGVYYSLSD